VSKRLDQHSHHTATRTKTGAYATEESTGGRKFGNLKAIETSIEMLEEEVACLRDDLKQKADKEMLDKVIEDKLSKEEAFSYFATGKNEDIKL
jgi:hypothetical protein